MPIVLKPTADKLSGPKLERLLGQPRWLDTDRALIDHHLAIGSLIKPDIYALDEFLTFREDLEATGQGEGFAYVQNAIITFGATSTARRKLSRARKALLQLFEASTLAGELGAAITEIHKKKRSESVSRHPGKALKHSIPERNLPLPWQNALNDMRDGVPGNNEMSAPAPEIVKGLARSVRQFAKCAQDAELPIRLSRDVAIAFEQSLARRDPPLSPYTIPFYLKKIERFGKYTGADENFLSHIADRVRVYARRAYGSSTRIEIRAMKVPDFKGILELAFKLLDEADRANLVSAHALCNRAAAIALVSPFPLRIADLSLRFGVNLTWNGDVYHLFIPETSKTGSPYSANIHPVFGMFIDRLVLSGRPSSQLDEAREDCLLEQRALFVNRSGKSCHRNYVSRCWDNVFGVGSHVARVKFHDEFAQLGAIGVEMALAACGQRDPKSAEFYRSKAFRQLAGNYVLETLSTGIFEDEWGEFFS